MQKVSACIVQYGDAQQTFDTLQSINAHTNGQCDIYVVDNASPDGAADTLEALGLPPNVRLIRREQNGGYGAGHNTVLPLLQSEYHAVINPDIALQSDAPHDMAAWLRQHPDAAIVTPRLIFPDGREQHIAKRRPALLPLIARQLPLPFLKRFERHYLMLDEDLSKPTDVEFCSGCFFMLRTETFRQMGGFDEGYFMYVEDADITRKAMEYGRAVYLPDITVVHAWQRAAHRRPKQFLWQLRSMLRYFKKWGFKLV